VNIVNDASIVRLDDPILVTGATGFIGARVVVRLLQAGYRNVRCFTRRRGHRAAELEQLARERNSLLEVIEGNLLSPQDCRRAVRGAAIIYHLAAARGEKSIPDAFMNSVVTTRNLLDAVVTARGHADGLRRFVHVSSFTVYAGARAGRRLLDESSPLESRPELRGDAYSFAKIKQEELVAGYATTYRLPVVIVRPGYVYGPGNEPIPGRVGLRTFGPFLHLGGSNTLPLTYVDNCADAVALAGLTPGIDGEIFNLVDDDLPSSRQFLRLYKRNVRRFRSIYVPGGLSYALCWLWEAYSKWSEGQLPPTFNRRTWQAYWGHSCYTNVKAKTRLAWNPRVTTAEALRRYFESCRRQVQDA
jgi:nucleoside-diphosphate-sugar epimerase